jgi:ATP/ADP translocase
MIVGITVGDSLLLTNIAQENVNSLYAWMHVGIAVVSVVVTWMYDRVMGLLSRIGLLAGMQFILLLSLLGFRQLIPSDDAQASEWLYFGLVVWIRVCSRLLIMLFFSFAGDYFTTHDAKRLYGYIAGGLAVGITVAGRIVDQVVLIIGAENLLYICMGFLSMGIGFSLFIYKTGTPVTHLKNSSDMEIRAKASLKTIFSQSYIQLLYLIVLIGLTCFVIVDFQMKVSAKNTYSNSTDLAAFFGDFYT